MPPKSVRKKNESLNLEQEVSIKIEWMYYHFEYKHTFTCLMLYTMYNCRDGPCDGKQDSSNLFGM